jgi:serine/threonine protein kinase
MAGEAPETAAVGAEPDPLLGRVVNQRYRVLEQIGQGGMGRVYKAVQAPLDRVVALKVLGAGHDRDPNFYKRFFLEASVTAKLTHPNSITLYDYGRTEDGIFFIAMEYLNGRTLGAAMQQDGPLAQDRVIHVVQQISRALREAHGLGIIHRDLKPANVLLLRQHDDHDFVKVLDFGLVKFFSADAADSEISNAGTFMGSPHYIAPEQARNQSPDQRCDIYSLGILVYQMLTGRVPFTAKAPVDIILQHLHEKPVPPSQVRPDLVIHPELESVVLRCIAKAREDRFQSMDELLLALKHARAQITGQTSAPPSFASSPLDVLDEDVTETPEPARREPRRRRWVLGAAIAAGAVAVGAVVGLVVRSAQPQVVVRAEPPLAVAASAPPSRADPSAPPQLSAAPKTTLVSVSSNPDGAEVRDLADRLLGVTPMSLRVPSDEPLRITLRRKGFKPVTVLDKARGEHISVAVTMKRDARAEPSLPNPNKRSVGYRDDPY